MNEKTPDETLITPHRRLWDIDWRELWTYRNFLWVLMKREFLSKYKQTLLGPLWFIVQPCLTTLIFTLIFSRGLKISTNGIPPALFYLCGLVPWSYFSHCINSISNSLSSHAQFFNRIYFPRLMIPLSIVLFDLIAFAVQSCVFLAFYCYFQLSGISSISIQAHGLFFLWFPLILLQTLATALGFGLWVMALTVKYRDFQYLTVFLMQLWMFLTPVIYPASAIPEKWRTVLALNPMAGVIESYRYVFFGTGSLPLEYFCISTAVSFVILVSGILIFNKVENVLVDTL